ncbi:mucin-5AC-like [Scomber scombrus]|uniref:mucin-5AC-like n=1 Tax=Scomber scombrus TaxID=13677 RepID=UPI002DDA60C8|nr:mucin-5AC-like [Scomber scombrus]
MEEREALKRQIDLLQNLINKHKSVHGDAPFTGVEQRHPEASISAGGRGHTTSVSHPHSFRGKGYVPQSRGSWKKAYSLRNKNPESSVGGHSLASASSSSSSSSVHQSSSQGLSNSTALPSQSRGEDGALTKTATLPSGFTQLKKEGNIGSIATINKVVQTSRKKETQQEEGQKGSSSAGKGIQHEEQKLSDVVLPGKKVLTSIKTNPTTTTTSLQKITQLQIKPSLTSKATTETKQTIPTTASANLTTIPTTPPPQSALSKVSKQPPVNPPKSQTSHAKVGAPFLPKSKFTWVKNQSKGGGEPKLGSSISSPAKVVTVAQTSGLKGGVSSPSAAVSKKTPAKKLPRKLSPVIVAPKTSKYKWVSSSAGAQARTLRKPLSPKAVTHPQRALEKGEATKKLKPGSTPPAKLKKGVLVSPSGSSLSTRYRWKAGGQKTSTAVTGGAAVTRRRSAFHWTSERSNKGVKGGLVVSPTLPQRASVPSSSPGGFKLRSRMKIIRRSTSSGCGSEKGSSPPAVKLSPRGRIYTLTRTPTGVRRTPSRELVSFGRHKLRRLSPTSSRTSKKHIRKFIFVYSDVFLSQVFATIKCAAEDLCFRRSCRLSDNRYTSEVTAGKQAKESLWTEKNFTFSSEMILSFNPSAELSKVNDGVEATPYLATRSLFKPPWVAVSAPTLASITAPLAAVALCRAATDLVSVKLSVCASELWRSVSPSEIRQQITSSGALHTSPNLPQIEVTGQRNLSP